MKEKTEYSGSKISLYKEFKQLVDEGKSPFAVATKLHLSEEDLIDFEVSYATEKQLDANSDSDNDFPFDGEAA